MKKGTRRIDIAGCLSNINELPSSIGLRQSLKPD